MMALLAFLGAVSLLGQVILLRELTVAFYGSELVILLGVGLWLLGTGFGALLGRAGREPRSRLLQAGLPAYALALPMLVALARGSRTLWGGLPGAYLHFPSQMAAMAAVMLPAALLWGLMFSHAARLAAARGRSLAAAYAVECAGGLVGGAAATVLPAAGVGNLAQALLCGALAAAALPAARVGYRGSRLAAAACAIVLVIALAAAPALDRLTTAWNHPDLSLARDTPYGRVIVEDRDGQLALFMEGALTFANDGTAAEEFVQLAALQRPPPRKVLLLGGGPAGLLVEARRLGAAQLVYVEMDRVLLDLMRTLPTDLGLGAGGPGAPPEVIVADPRTWLAGARGFDLVLLGGPEPASARDNRWYTREFFAACKDALGPAGVLAFRLQGSENVWTPVRIGQLAGIRRALAEVFPAVAVMPGTTTVFLASPAPLSPAADGPAARLRESGVVNRLVTPDYLAYLYANDRFADLRVQLAASDAPANTDLHPICYRQTLLLWTARFFPALGWRELEPPTLPTLLRSPWLLVMASGGAAVVIGVAVRARRRSAWRRNLAMAAAGAAGMMLEAALMLDYQVRVGVLYQDLGLLLCLFMLGMAAGAAALSRRPSPRFQRAELAALPVAALATYLLIHGARLGSLPATGAAMASCAAAVGVVFAVLSRSPADRQGDLAPRLLAADLVGSGFGCLVASLVLIPIWGQASAAAAAAVLGLVALAAAPPP